MVKLQKSKSRNISELRLLRSKILAMPDYMSETDELLTYERCKWDEGFCFVAGIDEAGRGCMAGPVTAATVIFTDRSRIPAGLNDSKKLTHSRRMELRELILSEPSILHAVADIHADEIDSCDILRATWRAMATALNALPQTDFVLVDGNPVKGLSKPSLSIVKGDSKSASIAAASILAKTHRDLFMERATKEYPQYAFDVHKGYCTATHIELVKLHGVCPLHRKTYAPIKAILNPPEYIQDELL